MAARKTKQTKKVGGAVKPAKTVRRAAKPKTKTLTKRKAGTSKPSRRKTAKPAAQTTAVASTVSVAPNVLTPSSVTAVAPVTPIQAIPEPGYKAVHDAPPQRFKLWLTVGLSMAVIVCIWAYSLSQSLLRSTAIADSSKALELNGMMEDIGGSLSTLKNQTDQFVQQATNQNSNTNGGDQPTNQQLDNLFSDLQ